MSAKPASTSPTAGPAPRAKPSAASSSARAHKPDGDAYRAAMAAVEAEMESLRGKLAVIKDRINKPGASGAPEDRRAVLKNRLKELRDEQAGFKVKRNECMDQIKALQSSIAKKTAEIKASRSKVPFRSTAELDQHIKDLEAQIESGQLKLIDEKRAISEISTLRRSGKLLDATTAIQAQIDADRAQIDEIRQKLDSHPSRAASDMYAEIQRELDALNEAKDADWSKRSDLFTQRNELSKAMDAVYRKKQDLRDEHRRAYQAWQEQHEADYKRKQDRFKKQREEEKKEKLIQLVAGERELLDAVAFVDEINTCDSVVRLMQGYLPGAADKAEEVKSTSGIRSDKAPEGRLLKSKKDRDDDIFFMGSGSGAKGKKPPKAKPESGAAATVSTAAFKVPLSVLERFLEIGVDAPMRIADIPAAIEAVHAKRAWFVDNQERVTAENRARIETRIAAILDQAQAEEDQAHDEVVDGAVVAVAVAVADVSTT